VEDPLAPDGKVSDQWFVLATVETIVNLGTAQESTKRFRALAAQYGGEYDGREAAATP
jgi:hypothetical protein